MGTDSSNVYEETDYFSIRVYYVKTIGDGMVKYGEEMLDKVRKGKGRQDKIMTG